MKRHPHRIDAHYHVIPRPYVEALSKVGINGSTYVPFPRWSPDMAVKHLDKTGVETAITSLSTPGVWFGDQDLARNLSRICNEFQAKMVEDYPGRFRSLACLPLPDVAGALLELEYALDTLGHDGVVLMTDIDGQYLGHPDYEEVFAELNQRKAVVFVHPHNDPGEDRRYPIFSPLLDWPLHTTRATIDLLYSGRLHRSPSISFILAHGGGTVPFLAHRIAHGLTRREQANSDLPGGTAECERTYQGALDALGSLYYDTAAAGASHLAALKRFVGPRNLVFATDGGWTPTIQTAQTIAELDAFKGFDDDERAMIDRTNLVDLIPALSREVGP